jgi:hypothetical protein
MHRTSKLFFCLFFGSIVLMHLFCRLRDMKIRIIRGRTKLELLEAKGNFHQKRACMGKTKF